MSALRWMGWSTGLAGLVGGSLWLAENANRPLADTQPAVTNAVSVAAPGLTAPAAASAGETDTETRLQRLEARVQTLGQQLQAQQQRLERSREEMARLAQALEQRPVGGAETSDEAVSAAEPPSAQEEQAMARERLTLLDRQVVSEGIDQEWSGPATEQIKSALAEKALAGSLLSNARCQATLCRIEVDSPDATALDRVLGELPVRLWSANSYSQVTTHEDGSATLVLYISREGYRLPKSEG